MGDTIIKTVIETGIHHLSEQTSNRNTNKSMSMSMIAKRAYEA